MATRVRTRLTPAEGRRFGLTLGCAFLLLAMVVLWRGRANLAVVLGIVGVVLMLVGMVVPTRLGPLQRAWMTFGRVLSFVTTPIVMAVLYFGVIMPIGLLRRMFAHSAIVHRETSTGYWKARASGRSSNMERQF